MSDDRERWFSRPGTPWRVLERGLVYALSALFALLAGAWVADTIELLLR